MKKWGSRFAVMVSVTGALVRCGSFEATPAQGLADAASDAPATDAPPSPTDGAETGECKNDALHLCDTFDDRAQAFAPSVWTRDEGGGAGALSSPARSAPNALAVEIADASLAGPHGSTTCAAPRRPDPRPAAGVSPLASPFG